MIFLPFDPLYQPSRFGGGGVAEVRRFKVETWLQLDFGSRHWYILIRVYLYMG